ncbi:MAG: monomethylamine:corrinoid methyltransferase [Desulfobacterales bacterium]|nr:monomethylamine:corrinoid methyltransferase [Desulfobacterales bacterium]
MNRQQANEIAKEILPKYEDKIKGDPKLILGEKYQDLYDMDTHRPLSEYVDFYNDIKKEIGKMGIKFRYNFLS